MCVTSEKENIKMNYYDKKSVLQLEKNIGAAVVLYKMFKCQNNSPEMNEDGTIHMIILHIP